MPLAPVKPLCAALLTIFALSATGCSTPSASPPVAIQCPPAPPLPALSHPIPSQTYSERARQKFKSWQEQLTPTPPMSKP